MYPTAVLDSSSAKPWFTIPVALLEERIGEEPHRLCKAERKTIADIPGATVLDRDSDGFDHSSFLSSARRVLGESLKMDFIYSL